MVNQFNLYRKLIKYRNIINLNKIKNKELKGYLIICDFNSFNGLALKLLKLNVLALNKNFLFKPYKNIIHKNLFYHKFKFYNKNSLFFHFKTVPEIFLFLENAKKLGLIPFCFFPLNILNLKKKIILSFKNVNLKFFNIPLSINSYLYSIVILLLKKIIIKLFLQLNLYTKKCQP